MRIIHVPDKSDYKSLMERLALDGYSWLGGEEIKWSNYSALHDKNSCVLIEGDKKVAVNSKGSFDRLIPEIEIETYREGIMDADNYYEVTE